jgi:curli biogenesis system outer membrane secretion channel CsgG
MRRLRHGSKCSVAPLSSPWPIALALLWLVIVGVGQASAAGSKTVAVWDFDNSTLPGATDVTWADSLQRVLSEALLADLNRIPALTTVERVNLRDILREQKLGSSDLADEASRLRLGNIAGARHMVFGSYLVQGDEVRIDVRAVEVETSLVELSESVTGSQEVVLQSMSQIAQKIARKVGAASTQQSAGSASIEVWSAYDQGILLMDAGKYQKALGVFKQVLKDHPNFKPAEKQITVALERIARQ